MVSPHHRGDRQLSVHGGPTEVEVELDMVGITTTTGLKVDREVQEEERPKKTEHHPEVHSHKSYILAHRFTEIREETKPGVAVLKQGPAVEVLGLLEATLETESLEMEAQDEPSHSGAQPLP